MKTFLLFLFLAYSVANLLRIAIYLISSDIYTYRQLRNKTKRRRQHLPTISVLIPAHNESASIARNLQSLYDTDYPHKKFEVIIINDGSTDNTKEVIREFIRTHKGRCTFRLINRTNGGKAKALNYALRRCAKNNLIMCLDADSYLAPSALRNGAQYFRDRNVVALSANVSIIEDGTILGLVQKVEYLMGHHMKKGQNALGLDYIIGGLGSMFRKSMLKEVSYYDTNTMTEDIDLTIKILSKKSKRQKLVYAADVITYTEAVHDLPGLMTQRYRWKYGRLQTFLKHANLFFSRDPEHSKRITWFMMPFVLLQDLAFSLEPLMLGYVIYIASQSDTLGTISSSIIFISIYVLFNVWSSDNLSVRERLRLSYYAPPMFLLILLTSIADYFALAKSTLLIPKLRKSLNLKQHTWRSPERKFAQ